MKQEHRRLTQNELVELILKIEPEMKSKRNGLKSIISETLRKYPKVFSHDQTTGVNSRY